ARGDQLPELRDEPEARGKGRDARDDAPGRDPGASEPEAPPGAPEVVHVPREGGHPRDVVPAVPPRDLRRREGLLHHADVPGEGPGAVRAPRGPDPLAEQRREGGDRAAEGPREAIP